MNSSLATVTILVSLLHVAALGVMIWIRVRRSEADEPAPRESGKVTACACVRRAGYRLELRRARSERAAGPAHRPGLVRRHDPLPAGLHGPLTGCSPAALAAELPRG